MKINFLVAVGLFSVVFFGCSSGGGSSESSKEFSSVSISSDTSRIAGYEIEVHCSDVFPNEADIKVNTDEVSINGRQSTVLGPQLDSQKQNFKIAVMSTGEEDGNMIITKAVEFLGCSDAQVLSSIVVDASADEIGDVEVIVNMAD